MQPTAQQNTTQRGHNKNGAAVESMCVSMLQTSVNDRASTYRGPQCITENVTMIQNLLMKSEKSTRVQDQLLFQALDSRMNDFMSYVLISKYLLNQAAFVSS